jgi:hypothetical protein
MVAPRGEPYALGNKYVQTLCDLEFFWMNFNWKVSNYKVVAFLKTFPMKVASLYNN